MAWYHYTPYVSVAQKQAKAQRQLSKLKKKNPGISPVVVQGRTIARTWWGKSWNQNLERYADYSNRIGRGRSYVTNGMVLDLQIQPGEVSAIVQGTASSPYDVIVQIAEIKKPNWKNIKTICQEKLESLSELLDGKFPKELADIFMTQNKGLFPNPSEIRFSCSCPDWASMCKHVAATLYGIGARLDEDPLLFFALRKADVNELISQAVTDRTETLLKKADKKSSRVIEDDQISDLFGIELGESDIPIQPKSKPVKRKTADTKSDKAEKKKPAQKGKKAPAPKKRASNSKEIEVSKSRKKVSRKKEESPKASAPKAKRGRPPKSKNLMVSSEKPAIEIVEGIILRSRKGVTIKILSEKTGFESKKLYNIVARLKREGRIKSAGWGTYTK